MNRTKRSFLISTFLFSTISLPLWGDNEDIRPAKVESGLVANIPSEVEHLLMENPHVKFLLLISEKGELLDRLATESNHYALLEAATRLIDQATYSPAYQDGVVVPSRLQATVYFRNMDQERWQATGTMPMGTNTMNMAEKKLYDSDKKRFAYSRSEPGELDQPLQLSSGSIVVLQDSKGKPAKGSVTVEYYIDHNGDALLPTILNDVDEVLAMSAIKTLERLKFAPPRRKGNPTYVKVRQTFDFDDE